jgi:uncharacterized protein (TIGR00725 family)
MKQSERKRRIAVIGAGNCDEQLGEIAEEVGRRIAELGAILICGGLGGVMEYAAKGAKAASGLTIGILPTYNAQDANEYIDIPIVTGLGHARNIIVVGSSDAVIAISGEYGTLSEIAFALKLGKPVIGLESWELNKKSNIKIAKTPADAVQLALNSLR